MYILLTFVHHDEGENITDTCTLKRVNETKKKKLAIKKIRTIKVCKDDSLSATNSSILVLIYFIYNIYMPTCVGLELVYDVIYF